MKKLKLFLVSGMIFACTSLFGIGASAANGDVIGKIYSTDILAKIDGCNVVSYNIGGKTAVIIEDMADQYGEYNYAIAASYDFSTRVLKVRMDSSKDFQSSSYDNITRGKVGEILGDVYETDIKVIFNGKEINGMNIGGKTAVALEDLGEIGGENEEYGLSKYRCKAHWDEEDRIISLDFIDPDLSCYRFAYNVPNVAFSANDNVITATFDRMNDHYSSITNVGNLSDGFIENTDKIYPLYYDDGTNGEQIGFMYTETYELNSNKNAPDTVYANYYITEPELFKEKLKELVTEAPTLEETFKILDDKKNYETVDKVETEDFYVLAVKDLNSKNEIDILNENYTIIYVAVKKTGGYSNIYYGSTLYNTSEIKKTGKNTVQIILSPYAGMHGANALATQFELEQITIY